MKNLILIFAFVISLGYQSYSQIDLDEEMMNGSTLLLSEVNSLVYGVDYYGNTYDFIVDIKSMKDGIEFDYEMTNAANTKGTVKMSREAVESAIAQNNYFAGGEMNLIDQTTVWVSKMVFMELVDNGSATISTDGGNNEIIIGNATAGHDYEMRSLITREPMSDVSYVYAESEDGSAKYWIHLSKYNPLILKMDLGWTITLKELR